MGKRKPRKKNELSVAIAEASSAGDAHKQRPLHPPELQSPRKRGRPRKTNARIETEEESKEHSPSEQQGGGVEATAGKERKSKRAKINVAEEPPNSIGQRQLQTKPEEASTSAAPDVIKRETLLVVEEAVTRKPFSGNRRKIKPRKSS